ncbi:MULTISPECIES: STAS domain-containing protein [unclassified Acidovorax]|uniref:STAS domain-containing protein n=1 Tax=unclassified Acidovorax TaxID=2684926 RepID=UPI002882DB86|nr:MULTISPECIES: STAS domain-containing protein [unclassified Acidovorax]
MTKEESSRGLLSKMARFVRNPTVNWTELDSIEADRESQYSKQVLKEMIERKRRNDFVRRREFDQLRKLRQREALHGQRTEDPTARPSFFQSSMASPDERAVTLKKIDEIEAQMSQQWWKGRGTGAPAGEGAMAGQPGQPGQPAGATTPVQAGATQVNAFAPTEPASLVGDLGQAPAVQPLFSPESIQDAASSRAPLTPPALPPAAGVAAPAQPSSWPEPPVFVHEPDLEEAAIRFANGDHAGAEAALRDVLALHATDTPAQQLDFWMTLFDLYRATGEHERFDTLAIDFAALFDRSAPMWFSLPALVGAAAATPAQDVPGAAQREFKWSAPPTLTLQSVAALQASTLRAPAPWALTWSRLQSIDAAVVPVLADLFSQWAEQDVQLVFHGVDTLLGVLQQLTPSGDRNAEPQGWRLHMAALRMMGRPDEFELVALDYCVTYEVSPPSWASPRCGYSGDDQAADTDMAALESPLDDPHSTSGFEISRPSMLDEPVAALSGRVEGDAGPLLAPLEAMAQPGAPLVVACERLIRVDFAAAGSVLNWTAEQEAQGRSVQFVNVPRLVAVFFNVIGINEHARVVPRTN